MNWIIFIDGKAKKYLRRIPKQDSGRVREALRELVHNPYAGDIEKMEGKIDAWRRRVGSYRIFYEIYEQRNLIYISEIQRRTSTTY
ncbi:hypothetical protein A3G55_02345 [Candidatus Giovannonibacteria bacterium RIFCSPLOWO2_12_FULL_44_25]|uniref:Plasmid stabilization system n=3 Tax=Candidatus Giovannoniibacteriota TaxID=1752738 RepID=A0A0G1IE84_9BACT|nr:MAG: hypothetical protein UW15_C0001G0020 [Parcubacteria group bacterium GW2011_GWC1_44_10]KKT57540.1 MAG: hypothetical protein UW49_C0003G0019 [Candidatus Giovannonibacteria bacterium GW2011_GWB1_44_23]KKT59801.1 MAG: hypothetical protein UW53_C0007G0019 [Candidatus Giovannonibacteria bacterium GW2011_GWA1_44_25]OGF49531.1 MAG: hypothetical protein A2120_00965 [Candidatus Giovannonibacteria bacterium GWA2_45_15]OGF60031.1 MAG: hypothetical protein A2W40_00510 [Candidatus Giovannonibacteria 